MKPSVAGALLLFVASSLPACCQQISSFDRDRAHMMLEDVASDVRQHYYDAKFHGIAWDDRVSEAKQKIDVAASVNGALSDIAAALDSLNDSHTFFLPPVHAYKHDYGWNMQMVGDHCYVTRVIPHSDAANKGLRPGDEVLALEGYRPTREDIWKLEYILNALQPQAGLGVTVAGVDGKERQLYALASVQPLKKVMDLTGEDATSDVFELIREGEAEANLMRARAVYFGDELMVLKFPKFAFSDSAVEAIIAKARTHKSLIIDLRQNGGGSENTLKAYLSGIFNHEVKIGDRVTRASSTPIMAGFAHNHFDGQLVVLVDSKSASAAELLARVVQVEKRGIVVGDHTAGSVMEAKRYKYQVGIDTVLFFGASITQANIVMKDGNSLEHIGVTPDEAVLPTQLDFASNSDPALARAAALCGVKLSPQDAGRLFPPEWAKN